MRSPMAVSGSLIVHAIGTGAPGRNSCPAVGEVTVTAGTAFAATENVNRTGAKGGDGALRSVAVLSTTTVYVVPTARMFNGIVTVSSRNVVFDQRNVFVAGPGSGAMENADSTDARFSDSENTIVMSWSGATFPCRFAGIVLSRVGAVLSITNSRTDSPHPTSPSVSCPHTRMRTVSESIVGTDHGRTFGFAVP